MIYYPYKSPMPQPLNNDRQFFVPFLLGGLAGGAAVGLTRPRPIYNVAPQGPMMPPPGVPYGQYSYNYYYPFR